MNLRCAKRSNIPNNNNAGPIVINTNASGLGSLHQAITDANANLGADLIQFNIPGVGPFEIAPLLGLPTIIEPVTIDGLAEVQVGVDGFDVDEVDRYFAEGARRPLADHWDGWPGAETFHDFHERVTSGIEEILKRHDCRAFREDEHDFTLWKMPEREPSIAIVAHGGTNSVVLTHLLDIRPVPWEWLRFETGLAAFSIAQARPIGPRGHVWSLQGFNRDDHLHAAGLK